MHSSYLITGEFVIILIISIMALWNIFRSAGNKFTDSQRGSNFEFIVYVAGELALSLFIGHILLVLASYLVSLFEIHIGSAFSEKVFLICSFIFLIFVYLKTKAYINEDEKKRRDREKAKILNLINDLSESIEFTFCKTRYNPAAVGDVLHPEDIFKTKVYPNEEVTLTLENDDSYGFLIVRDFKRMYFHLSEDTPTFNRISEYIKYFESEEN